MISELGGAAMHSGLQTRGLPGYRGRMTAEQIRAAVHPEDRFHTPRASIVALENTHNSAGGSGLAARRARGGRRGGARARARGPSRRRADRERRGRARRSGRADRAPVRHGHAVPLEGARLPARRGDRGLARADGAGPGREAPLRRRDAAGRDRRRRRPLRARAQRRAARRRPRPRAAARRGLGRARCPGRPRLGRDELRPGRRRRARAHLGRGDRAARRQRASA